MKKFTWEEIKKYIYYVGDSYAHARQLTPTKPTAELMDCFSRINKLISEAAERYKLPSPKT